MVLRLLAALLCLPFSLALHAQTEPPIPAGSVRIHYHRPDGAYSGWTVYAFDNTTENTGAYGTGPVTVTGSDSYGVYFDVGVTQGAQEVGLILHNPSASGGDQKDPGPNEFVDPATEGNEYWAWSGIGKLYTAPPNPAAPTALLPGYARIHYYRPDGNYANWTVYAFNDTAEYTGDYNSGLTFPTNYDAYGAYFDIRLTASPADLGFIVHNVATGSKDPGPDMHLAVNQSLQAWVISGSAAVYTQLPSQSQILAALLGVQQAYWMDHQRVAIPPADAQNNGTYALSYAPSGGLAVTTTGITGGSSIPLTPGGALTRDELTRFPQLSSYSVLQLPASVPTSTLAAALKGQLALSVLNSAGQLTYATGVQIAPVLDDLFFYSGPLGVVFTHPLGGGLHPDFILQGEENYDVLLKVWAPTAQSVTLQLYNSPTATTPFQTVPMHNQNGVWSAGGPGAWAGKYYLYNVHVWVPSDNAVDSNLTTDPYSIDLALNGTMSRITDLNAPTTQPVGWGLSGSPSLASLNDLSIYELHVRDFSIADPSVPEADRGTYDAFADEASDGMKHLHALALDGLKAVHILPSFHFASVNEDKSTWIIPEGLAQYPADGTEQQAAVTASQANPAYNWGYDPVHYMAPEGAYAKDPDSRVLEYRTMVQGLHRAGLRVIQDVVFNHTNAAGEGPNSPLDEVVPNYYHRLDTNGALEESSCCPDIDSSHRMVEKLMTDTLVMNAREYKIDGFRFDEMYQHFLYNMADIEAALHALNPLEDGVDGSKLYIYGEGWNAGATANNAIGPSASQLNLYGYGIGTFNDRIRDGIRGPLGDLQAQGFATGLFTDPSGYTGGTNATAFPTLLSYSDLIDVSLTGNLRDFTFQDSAGQTVTGAAVSYNGVPAGYTASPIEAINYASVHDNEDLFDAVQTKSALSDTIEQRARRQVLAMSIVTLGEGIPFFQGGDDLLRSKDMDTNSYDSGDWFNKIDWTGQTANWGIGLPVASQNQSYWPIMQPLLANDAYTPKPAQISFSGEAFQEFLKIRYSSGLFRMASEPEIQRNLAFLNVGPSQTPGAIAMLLSANGGSYGPYQHVLVVINGTPKQLTFTHPTLKGMSLSLHPVQAASPDTATHSSAFDGQEGTATVPALTTAVFVSAR